MMTINISTFRQSLQIMVRVGYFQAYTFKPELFPQLLSHNIENIQPSTNNQNSHISPNTESYPHNYDPTDLHLQNPSLFIYQQHFKDMKSIGVITAIHLADYQNGSIKKHERTLDKQDRNAHTYRNNHIGPVTLAYSKQQHGSDQIQKLILKAIHSNDLPIFSEWNTIDGRHHTLWKLQQNNIKTNQISKQILDFYQSIDHLYILDGHHRFSAAYQNYLLYQRQHTQPSNQIAKEQWIQGIIFSSSNIQVHSQHRKLKSNADFEQISQIINQLNVTVHDLCHQRLLKQIRRKKINHIKQTNQQQQLLTQIYDIILISREKLKGIKINKAILEHQSKQLDNIPSYFLDQKILMPLFNHNKKQLQKNIQYIPGIHNNLNEIFRKKSANQIFNKKTEKSECLFIVKPLSALELFRLADQQLILPPKTTWLEPKPCLKMVVSRLSL